MYNDKVQFYNFVRSQGKCVKIKVSLPEAKLKETDLGGKKNNYSEPKTFWLYKNPNNRDYRVLIDACTGII